MAHYLIVRAAPPEVLARYWRRSSGQWETFDRATRYKLDFMAEIEAEAIEGVAGVVPDIRPSAVPSYVFAPGHCADVIPFNLAMGNRHAQG